MNSEYTVWTYFNVYDLAVACFPADSKQLKNAD